MEDILVGFGAFLFVTLSAKQLGEFLTRFKFPLISGYLLAGIIAGPFMLDFIHADTVYDLRFVDEFSLAFIAFAAGSEMYLEELKSRLKTIAWHTAGLVFSVYSLGSITVFLLADYIPFMQDMDTAGRIAVAILAGSILVARSPSSAIAIVNELRAKGPFTKTILGVTIVMDVIVVVIFAINSSIADMLLTAEGFNIGFVVLLFAELSVSFLLGYLIGRVIQFILISPLHKTVKITLILLAGYGVFLFSSYFRDFTHEHFSFEVLFEPLLVCMVASFWVTNYSEYRTEFLYALEDVAPFIYVMFFTLVGDAIQLDILAETWQIAVMLFLVRLLGIFIGSFGGGTIAGDPAKYNRIAWMSYITQAGVGLGLAKQAADEFPEMGDEFATIMISVIVLTQLVGPVFFKIAIKKAGEAHLPGMPEPDQIRDVLILGINAKSLALARQLIAHHWNVIVAGLDKTDYETFVQEEIPIQLIPEISADIMCGLMTKATDAMVMMLDDDADSYHACEVACEEYGVPRLVVRLNDYAWADRFIELGAKIIYPASAVVNLLDQYVRAPQSADMFMHTEGHEVVQITITDKDIDGIPLRKLRLPADVLVLGIVRDGNSIVPHGYTVLRYEDDITLVGNPESLEEVTLRLGY
jgi:Trk K+ transport system NAD-binding subunit/Kef-type K+ transport system membrane component KefB